MNRIQHPSNNYVIGAPQGMSNEECGALPITVIKYNDGMPGLMSYWKPTAEELQQLNQGYYITLICLGGGMPPVILGVAQ